MNNPHPTPHQSAGPNPLDRAIADLASDLERELGKTGDTVQSLRDRVAAAPASTPAQPPSRPPAAPAAAPRSQMWGPPIPPTGPISRLQNTSARAHEVHRQMVDLVKAFSGQEPQAGTGPRLSTAPIGVLPRVGQLADEIEGVLNEIGRLVEHLKGQV